CRQEARESAVERADVERERGPAVLARRDEAVEQLGGCRAHVGLGPRATRKLHQCVRLFAPGAMDPARAMVLEAPRDKMHAVGEQRGRERITGVAVVTRAVELERQSPRAIDNPARGQATRLRQGASPGKAAPGRALPWISWVR